MSTVTRTARTQYVYDLASLDRVPDGPTSAQVIATRLLSGKTLQTGKSSTVGAGLTGTRIIVALGRMERGSGSKAHTHPNEQFNYILQGTMTWEVGEEVVFAPKGTLMHTPAKAVHTGLACPDEDLMFFAMKDTRHGLVGPPVDGKYDGPAYLPGFGTRDRERRRSTAELMAEAGRDPAGVRTRYIYDFGNLAEKPGRTSSATVMPQVSAPAGSGVTGSMVTGEMLRVALLRYARGGAARSCSNPGEQFAFVVEGELRVEVNGEVLTAGKHCAVHVPPGVTFALAATRGSDALVVSVQEARHPFIA